MIITTPSFSQVSEVWARLKAAPGRVPYVAILSVLAQTLIPRLSFSLVGACLGLLLPAAALALIFTW
jgi:hypothetical protein